MKYQGWLSSNNFIACRHSSHNIWYVLCERDRLGSSVKKPVAEYPRQPSVDSRLEKCKTMYCTCMPCIYMHSQNIRSGCRRISGVVFIEYQEWLSSTDSESADILPCEPLAQHTAVTSQDHWNCNDNYLNVNSANDRRSYSCSLFMSWFCWIISQNEKFYSSVPEFIVQYLPHTVGFLPYRKCA